MIARELVDRGIHDGAVLQAFREVPRHAFVEPVLRFQAYNASALPIGKAQSISQPYMVARMTESLCLNRESRVLDIGTGSGYQAAILSRICHQVYSVERLPALVAQAKQRLSHLGYHNVSIKLGDGFAGWPEYAPYDGIVVAAFSDSLPMALYEQLKLGGRLIMPIGNAKKQELFLFVRNLLAPKKVLLGECQFVPFVKSSK